MRAACRDEHCAQTQMTSAVHQRAAAAATQRPAAAAAAAASAPMAAARGSTGVPRQHGTVVAHRRSVIPAPIPSSMSAARGEPMRRDDGEVPPHVSGATVDAGLAELEHESSEELFGQLPRPILMKAMMTRGTAEWCLMTVPHAARDARARACFADLPEAAVVLRELRARAARSPLLALLSAYSAEDFNNVSNAPDMHEMHVFRRVAFRSANMVMPNSNAADDVRDAGEFEIDAWKLLPSLRAQVGDDALNGSAQVKALLLTHVFPGALSKGRELALSTLLYNGGMGPEMPPQLLRDAYYDFRRPCSAALRAARVASRVGVEGATLTSAQVAGLGPASREALERGRRAQLLHALLHCVEARWPGGVLMLRRFFDASAFSEELRAALDALCIALRAACELPPAAEEDEPPMPMPPLPESTCGFCGEAMGAARHLCSRCRDVRYHGAECQAAHWPEHKLVCRPAEPAALYARFVVPLPPPGE